MLYTCAIFLVQLTHRVFYPRLTPNRLRVPQQCTLCNYWRPSTQFHLHEATKHQALVLHLHQKNKQKNLLCVLYLKKMVFWQQVVQRNFIFCSIKSSNLACSLKLSAGSTARDCGCRSTTHTQRQLVLQAMKTRQHGIKSIRVSCRWQCPI